MYHIILWLILIFGSVISGFIYQNIFLILLLFLIFSINVAYNFIKWKKNKRKKAEIITKYIQENM